MLDQQKISDSIALGKAYSAVLMEKVIAAQANGDDVTELQNKFTVINQWILILQDYLDTNYDQDGNIIPSTTCLSLTQILELVSKMKVAAGNTVVTENNWILASGFWNDSGLWVDSATWNDYPNFN